MMSEKKTKTPTEAAAEMAAKEKTAAQKMADTLFEKYTSAGANAGNPPLAIFRAKAALDAEMLAGLSEDKRAIYATLNARVDVGRVPVHQLRSALEIGDDLDAIVFLMRPLRADYDPTMTTLPLVDGGVGVRWPRDNHALAVLQNEEEADAVIAAYTAAVSGMPAETRPRFIPIKVPREYMFDVRKLAELVGLHVEMKDRYGYARVDMAFLNDMHELLLWRAAETEKERVLDGDYADPHAPARDLNPDRPEPCGLLHAKLQEVATEKVNRCGKTRAHLEKFWRGKIPVRERIIPAVEAHAARAEAAGLAPAPYVAPPSPFADVVQELRDLRALIASKGIEVPPSKTMDGAGQ